MKNVSSSQNYLELLRHLHAVDTMHHFVHGPFHSGETRIYRRTMTTICRVQTCSKLSASFASILFHGEKDRAGDIPVENQVIVLYVYIHRQGWKGLLPACWSLKGFSPFSIYFLSFLFESIDYGHAQTRSWDPQWKQTCAFILFFGNQSQPINQYAYNMCAIMKKKRAKRRETRPDLHTCSVGTRWTDSSIVKIRLQNFVQNLFLLFTDVGFGLWNLSQTGKNDRFNHWGERTAILKRLKMWINAFTGGIW